MERFASAEESWQTHENAEDFASLANYSGKYMTGAHRFDVGEKYFYQPALTINKICPAFIH